MYRDKAAVYGRTQIQTMTPEKLVLMLYQGEIKFLILASEAIGKNDIEAAHENLIKAQNILTELRANLDFTAGGEIAENLDALYGFMVEELVKANAGKEPEKVTAVLALAADLEEAWKTMLLNGNVLKKNAVNT